MLERSPNRKGTANFAWEDQETGLEEMALTELRKMGGLVKRLRPTRQPVK